MKEVFQTINDLCFEAKRILEKERDNSLFHERLFGASVKKDNNALIWKGKMPIGLTIVTAGWDPRAILDEIHAFGSNFLNKFEGIFPFTSRNKSFCLVSCLFLFASKSPCSRLVKAINSGGDIPKDGPCIAYIASKATIEAFKCGVEGGSSLSLSDWALHTEGSCESSTCTTSPEDEAKVKTKKTTDVKEKKKEKPGMERRGKDGSVDGTHVYDAGNETSTSESEGEVKMPKVRKKDNANTKDDDTHHDVQVIEMLSSPEKTNTNAPAQRVPRAITASQKYVERVAQAARNATNSRFKEHKKIHALETDFPGVKTHVAKLSTDFHGFVAHQPTQLKESEDDIVDRILHGRGKGKGAKPVNDGPAGVDAITIEESPAGGKVQNTRGGSQTARLRAQSYKRDCPCGSLSFCCSPVTALGHLSLLVRYEFVKCCSPIALFTSFCNFRTLQRIF